MKEQILKLFKYLISDSCLHHFINKNPILYLSFFFENCYFLILFECKHRKQTCLIWTIHDYYCHCHNSTVSSVGFGIPINNLGVKNKFCFLFSHLWCKIGLDSLTIRYDNEINSEKITRR